MKVTPKIRKVKKVETITNRRGKKKSNCVDLRTLTEFLYSHYDRREDSGDSDGGDISNDGLPNNVTRAINDHQQEGGVCRRMLVFM
jgi:hypothetical protein